MRFIGAERRYVFRTTFRAPLPFVFRWCTDYSPRDPALERSAFLRKIVRRAARHIVYEDLEETRDGWVWSRQSVALHPPARWVARAEGNHRSWRLEYRLRDLGDGRTELTLRGRRRATELGGPNPSPSSMERELRTLWRNFGAALERDYRARAERRRPSRRR